MKRQRLNITILIILIAFITGSFKVMASNKQNIPDFAYPETVAKDSEKNLEKALKDGDFQGALRSAMNHCIATTLRSNKSTLSNIAMFDSLAKEMPSPWANIARLLEAELYRQFYSLDRWSYNRRVLPLENPWPDDMSQWSGEMFATKVLELINRAVPPQGIRDKSFSYNVDNLNELISLDSKSQPWVTEMDIEDYILLKGATILKTFSNGGSQSIIPFFKDERRELTISEKCQECMMDLYERVIEKNRSMGNSVIEALAIKEKLESYNGNDTEKLIRRSAQTLSNKEGFALLAQMLANIGNTEAERKHIYGQCLTWLDLYPNSPYSGEVEGIVAKLSEEYLSANYPRIVVPGDSVEVTVRMDNITEIYLLVYEIDRNYSKWENSIEVKSFNHAMPPLKTIKLEANDTVPFSVEKSCSLGEFGEGRYVVIPSKTKTLPRDWKKDFQRSSLDILNVSCLDILSFNDPSENGEKVFYVVDSRNQKPIEGASVIIKNGGYYDTNVVKTALSGKDGSVKVKNGYYNIVAYKGNSCVNTRASFDTGGKFKRSYNCNIFTDLSVYRQGDVVQFSIIAWEKTDSSTSLMKNKNLTIELIDPNWNVVDTFELKTDNAGRGNGKFTIPSSGLLGSYRLRAKGPDFSRSSVISFQVADYKLPGFFVTVDQVQEETETTPDSIMFDGCAKTYSGMPLAGSTVNYEITYQPWWWLRNAVNQGTFSAITVTDANGNFRIKLPLENLKGTDFEEGSFNLMVSVTSPDGETQEAPLQRFSLGEAYTISPEVTEKIRLNGDTLTLRAAVKDALGFPAIKNINYRILDFSEKEVLSGEFISPVGKVNVKDLPSGIYEIVFSLTDDGRVCESRQTVIYRGTDKRAPYKTPLWIPEGNIVAENGTKEVDVTIGSGYSDSWIFYSVKKADKPIKHGWLHIDRENNIIKVPVPEGYDRVEVVVSGLRDFESRIEKVTVLNSYATRKLNAKVETFRDRLTAGEQETWKFSFTVDSMKANDVYGMAVLTDKALNSIAPFGWGFGPNLFNPFFNQSISLISPSWIHVYNHFYKTSPDYRRISFSIPDWQTYGYSLVETDHLYRDVLYSRKAVAYSMAPMVASGMDANMESAMAFDDAEVAEEESVDTGAAGENQPEQEPELRPIELPVAFFMPELTANEDGEINVEFHVPNFNTTWQFQLLAYDKDLLSTVTVLDAIASKPVMARANMPQYLLTGDHTVLRALLFNNSDTVLEIGGKIQILNPLTNEVIKEEVFAPQIVDASGHRKVSLDYDVPNDLSQVEIRVIATGVDFSDGEKVIVPIYPSSSPVTESVQFYMGSHPAEVSVEVPILKDDANVTLKYCNNPIKECMLALPALSTPDSKTALVLSKALYSNCMALKLADDYPVVRAELEKLFQTEEYKNLRSSLELDADLKVVGLQQSPWVNNARDERERMMKLGRLLDKNETTVAIDKLLEDLLKLQNPDGGWSWCEGMKSSLFMTEEVLLEFGELIRGGAFPDKAREACDRAMIFCDNQILADYKKYKTIPVSSMLEYLYTKSFFKNIPSEDKEFIKLKELTLKEIEKEWKKFSIREKAEAAILFYRTKGLEKHATEILKSLDEFATKDDAKGWYFDNMASGFGGWSKLLNTSMALNAFAEIEPESVAVDGMRQWLLLQKETEDWGSRDLTVQVIQSILGSGTEWGSDTIPPSVTINGNSIKLGEESLHGDFTVSLKADEVSGKTLTIRKRGNTPSWGGVISQYVAPMKEVKAVPCENLEIRKQILRIDKDGGVTSASEGDYSVGDKIRITLTVVCEKDMDYVAIVDERGACLQPDEWLSGYGSFGDAWGYRETRDTKTSFFIEFLPKGTHVITYDCHLDREGDYSTGIATVQCQMAPQNVAHSAGQMIGVVE